MDAASQHRRGSLSPWMLEKKPVSSPYPKRAKQSSDWCVLRQSRGDSGLGSHSVSGRCLLAALGCRWPECSFAKKSTVELHPRLLETLSKNRVITSPHENQTHPHITLKWTKTYAETSDFGSKPGVLNSGFHGPISGPSYLSFGP